MNQYALVQERPENLVEVLNKMAMEGWEPCSAVSYTESCDAPDNNGPYMLATCLSRRKQGSEHAFDPHSLTDIVALLEAIVDWASDIRDEEHPNSMRVTKHIENLQEVVAALREEAES